MNTATSNLLQSKYFTPVFNTAIFDGPVRMYFAQHQEPDALRIYFRLQEMINRVAPRDEESSQLFVMLYPNDETFFQSFEQDTDTAIERLGEHVVLGLRGPLEDEEIDALMDRLESEIAPEHFGNA